MSAATTRLALTKPGGGSTGLITPPDPVDIDVLNVNFDKIDDAIGFKVVTSVTRPNTPFNGQPIYETDTKRIAVRNSGAGTWDYADAGLEANAAPVGSICLYAGAAAPNAKWLIPTGQAVSRATYADLFALIGTTYGAGDGATTFNLPDLQGRSPLGVGTRVETFTFLPAAVATATDIITLASTRNIPTGTPLVLTNSGGAVPTGLIAATTYYAIKLTDTTYQLASSAANAKAGVQVDITAVGSGTNTLTLTDPAITLGQKIGAALHTHGSTSLLVQMANVIARFVNGKSWTATNSTNLSVPGGAGTAATTGPGVQGNTDEEYNYPPSLGLNYIIKALP